MPRMLTAGEANLSSSSRGFSYVIVLVLIALLSLGITATNRVTSTIVKREVELELISRGLDYRRAIERYYYSGTAPSYPIRLSDLVKDPRFVYKSHMRRLVGDPVNSESSAEDAWNLIRNDQGGIVGVSSKSTRRPLKKVLPKDVNVVSDDEGATYQSWQFVFIPAKKNGLLQQSTLQ